MAPFTIVATALLPVRNIRTKVSTVYVLFYFILLFVTYKTFIAAVLKTTIKY